jgi:thiamine biosynthesis lipoprotein
MSNRAKNIIYSLVLLAAFILVYQYRKRNASAEPVKLEGFTMGTTYHITYFDSKERNFQPQIDSILRVFDLCLSTYNPASEITAFNKGDRSFTYQLPYFRPVVEKSAEIALLSGGAFDPTVMPLVNAWGFGPEKTQQPDSTYIDSVLQFVGIKHIQFNSDSVWKDDHRAQLDFNAVAPGYGVDVIADFIRSKGVTDVFVEIGGEVMTWGKNRKTGEPWLIGIVDPRSTQENQKMFATVKVSDRAISTSGNYFSYREVDGKRYSHTINPKTGYPVILEILSATVFAPDCTAADAWATACMTVGHERAIELLKDQKQIDVLLIYSGEAGELKTYVSPGIAGAITFEEGI